MFAYNTKKQSSLLLQARNQHDSLENITSVAEKSLPWCLHSVIHSVLHQIENEKNVDPCVCCFSKVVLMGEEEDGKI